MSKFATVLTALSLASAHTEEPTSFLADVTNGKVPKSQVEVVLAQHNEDVAWSDPLAHVRTVYCKGRHCADGAIKLPNVGREGHTFLHHIVKNYENLANWTVFSQAEKPTDGYIDHKRGGGHMLTGMSFDDYLMPPEGNRDHLFLMTSKVHLPTLRTSLRSSFKTRSSQTPDQIASKSATCPQDPTATTASDVWGEFHELSQVRRFLSHKCGVEENALSSALKNFWDDFVQLPLPAGEVLHYAQGARFAASKERIHQRSKAYYEHLLEGLSYDSDPCLNYLFEFAWYYIIGSPSTAPCPIGADDVAASTLQGRLLADGSGASGGVSTPTDEDDELKSLVQFEGTIVLSVDEDSAPMFLENETAEEAVEESLANVYELEKDWVDCRITSADGSGRRLATSLNVEYTITFPEDEEVDPDDIASVWSAGEANFTAALIEATGITVTVESFAAPTALTVTQTSTTTTTEGSGGVAGSVRSSFSGVVALVLGLVAVCLA